MRDHELGEVLSELEEIRVTAETELKAIRGRKAALKELERDRDALLESYVGMIPNALSSLAPERRRQVYGMLRLRVEVSADSTMQVRGVLSVALPMLQGEVGRLCENELAPRCKSQNAKHLELRFHTVLGNGDREVRLEWGRG
jgi:hypothetical protein